MRTLVVEDDFVTRNFLQKILSSYGECEIAVDGKEAVKAFELALDKNTPYDLVCLDIMLPEFDGLEVLKKIREYEQKKGIGGLDGVKIIMVTAKDDPKTFFKSFRLGCESYIVKPVVRNKLLEKIIELNLLTS